MTAALQPATPDYTAARFNMVESQLRPNKVRDERLLEAMGSIPRELFAPAQLAAIAYIDEDLQVAPGRFLLEPMVLARLIQAAEITPQDRVLDVAPTRGYSTAVLAALAQNVAAVESDPELVKKAEAALSQLKIGNVETHNGPAQEGWEELAPYNAILINGAIEFVPESLKAQLADGGRLVAVVQQFGPARLAHTGEARLYEKIRGSLSYRPLFNANVKPLAGFEAKRAFAF